MRERTGWFVACEVVAGDERLQVNYHAMSQSKVGATRAALKSARKVGRLVGYEVYELWSTYCAETSRWSKGKAR